MADILSVGIDIGTSTTQLVFSRISMKNTMGYFSVPRVEIVDKEVLYKSAVCLTPLLDEVRIDAEAVRQIVAKEYEAAGYTPGDVDTGAVIITGESARKENAAAVLQSLSDFAGDFVVSTAGPDLESVIAGKGSGAWQKSLEEHCVTANLDIGGGTTNIVLFQDGAVIAKGCYDIGGRLVKINGDSPKTLINYISPSAMRIAEAKGIDIHVGDAQDFDTLKALTDAMAELLAQAMGASERTALLEAVRTAGSDDFPLPSAPIAKIFFSGGVADFFKKDAADLRSVPYPYGDIGALLGASLAEGTLVQRLPVEQSSETIRATVVGAGTYTTTISGSTITYAETLFPVKNVPALKLTAEEQAACFAGHRGFLADKLRWFLAQSDSDNLILALPGKKDPSYLELKAFAQYLADETDAVLPPGAPLFIVLEEDMAKALGILIEKALAGRRKLACIDGIHVESNDYVDMGRPLVNGLVIPVVVKTLLFG